MATKKCTIPSKPISKWEEMKSGDKFVVVRGDCGYPKNKVLTMSRDGVTDSDGDMNDVACECPGKSYLRYHYVERVLVTVADMEEKLTELKAEADVLASKIAFCNENGTDVYNEDEFAIYRALDVLDGAGTRQEKAKALAGLLNRK